MSIPGTLWKVLCCGQCKHSGEVTHKYFPRNEKELKRYGKKWLTKVLTNNGVLQNGVKVDSVNFEDNNSGGLLGEMCVVNLSYSGPSDAPTKLMAKFRPPDLETKITTTLFNLCQNEYDFYRTIQPAMGVRIPKMVFGDFHRGSAAFVMLFEFVKGEFLRVQKPLEKDKAVLIVKTIAAMQKSFWGALSGPQGTDISFIDRMDEGAMKLIPKVTKTHFKTFYTGLCAAEAKHASKEIQAALPGMIKDLFTVQVHQSTRKKWMTVNHGDTRTDNWFFNEPKPDNSGTNEIGVIDWQLMTKSCCANDISWFFSTSIDADCEYADELIEEYFNTLVKILDPKDSAGLTLAELKEELAIAHLSSLAKVVIGAGGLDKNDANTIDVMCILCKRCLKAMERHGTVAAYNRMKEGKLLSQQPASSATPTEPSATQVTPFSSAKVNPVVDTAEL
jgi:hypothetical protein